MNGSSQKQHLLPSGKFQAGQVLEVPFFFCFFFTVFVHTLVPSSISMYKLYEYVSV